MLSNFLGVSHMFIPPQSPYVLKVLIATQLIKRGNCPKPLLGFLSGCTYGEIYFILRHPRQLMKRKIFFYSSKFDMFLECPSHGNGNLLHGHGTPYHDLADMSPLKK